VLKIVKLTTIHNGIKQTISTGGRLGLLQVVSEPDTEQCACWAPKRDGLCDNTSVGEENETFLIRL